jgi:hypothetical protein
MYDNNLIDNNLDEMMHKLGFIQSLIDIVMGMISSVSFSILFNGEAG